MKKYFPCFFHFLSFSFIFFHCAAQAQGYADLVEKYLPSVVNIATKTEPKRGGDMQQMVNPFAGTPFENMFPPEMFQGGPMAPGPSQALGSGLIFSADGYIITNNHVVESADEVIVKLHDDETEYTAKVIGADDKTDIALLKITPKGVLQAAQLGDSERVRVGDAVLAIGNPFGLGGSVTSGIVSALGRNINQGPYDDFIQTDAAINPGNSGGPLFNDKGEVVGINTAIFSRSGGYQGIGFAVPINVVKLVVEQLKEHGRTIRGWLGVRIQPVTKDIAEAMGLSGDAGALVANVEAGSPAAEAGFQSGDVIVKFDGQDIKHMSDLPKLVAAAPIGKRVEVGVVREGKTVNIRTTIAELKSEQVAAPASAGGAGEKTLGLSLRGLDSQLRTQYGVPEGVEGVLVENVAPFTPAAEAGVRRGDVIRQINRQNVRTVEEAKRALERDGNKSVLLFISRAGQNSFVAVKRPEKK